MTSRARLLWTTFLSACMAVLASEVLAETRSFQAPSVRGVRLDWCRHFGRDCGQPAADLFCREMGFATAARFLADPNIGARGIATLVFGDGALCQAPNCSGFRVITCARPDPAPAPPTITVNPLTLQPAPPVAAPPAIAAPPTIAAPPPLAPPVAPPRPPIQMTVPPGNLVVPVPPPKPATADRSGPSPLTVGPLSPSPASVFPAGAELYHCARSDCEFALTHDLEFKAHSPSQTVNFRWFATQVAGAGGMRWQVAAAPFAPFSGSAADLGPPQLVASGESRGDSGNFTVDFRTVAAGRPPPDSFYVRILPLVRPGGSQLAGQPSNVIRVWYGGTPPPQPPIEIHDTRPQPLFIVRLISFTPPTFFRPSRWGCVVVRDNSRAPPFLRQAYPVSREICPKSYKGAGNQITSFGEFVEWAAGGVLDAWDWLGDRYEDVKQLAVTVVLKYSGFGLQCEFAAGLVKDAGLDTDGFCRTVAEQSVNAGMVALGLPPSIPSYNELVDKGVDYAVEIAVETFEEQTGVPCVGPCRDALVQGFQEAADNLKRAPFQPGCVSEDEAHKHGREPLCLPASLVVKPAPGAIDTPPLATAEIVRRTDVPNPRSPLHPSCHFSVGLTFHNQFPGGRVSGPSPAHSMEVPAQAIEGALYAGYGETLSLAVKPGTAHTVSVIFAPKLAYIFPWTRKLWATSQFRPRDELGPMGPDWFTLVSGATARVVAQTNCAAQNSVMNVTMPRL